MKELSLTKMETLEGGGWLSCGAMVLGGIGTVALTVGLAAAGPLGWLAIGAIAGSAGATFAAGDSCASN